MKMEPIEGSETSAFKPQTPGKYPKENILINTQCFFENSGNTLPAIQSHIPEDLVKFITTLVPSGYHRYCGV